MIDNIKQYFINEDALSTNQHSVWFEQMFRSSAIKEWIENSERKTY